jgi:YgiT-type zinc finger domain-containing protein
VPVQAANEPDDDELTIFDAKNIVLTGEHGRRTASSSRPASRTPVVRWGLCGDNQAQQRHVTRRFGRGGRPVVIENIPYIVCPRCGERYFTAATMREIERLKQLRTERARRKPVAVFSFGAA